MAIFSASFPASVVSAAASEDSGSATDSAAALLSGAAYD